MYASCPDCETELDQTTGICPACRWDPILSITPIATQLEQGSLVERYHGSERDFGLSFAQTRPSTPVSRMRLLVLLGLLVMATLYVVVLAMLGTV